MARWPIFSIFIFLAGSILTAFLYQTHEGRGIASKQDSGMQNFWKAWDRGSARWSGVENAEAGRCRCLRPETRPQVVEFDRCEEGNARARQDQILPPLFRESRNRSTVDFPRACLTYVLKEKSPGDCVSEASVTASYNLLGDLTSCLRLPQRDFLPRLLAEIHDPGSNPAVPSAALWGALKERLVLSDDPSCETVSLYLKEVSAKPAGSVTADFFVSLVDLVLRTETDLRKAEMAVESADLLSQVHGAGLTSLEPEQLQQWIVLLGAQVGPEKAVSRLQEFLSAQKKRGRLASRDFEIGSEKSGERSPASAGPAVSAFDQYLTSVGAGDEARMFRAVKSEARHLNEVFQEGTCVPESYLSFSVGNEAPL